MKTLLSRAALAAAAMALGLSGAQATTDTATGQLNVKLTVISSCSVGTSSLDFGRSSLATTLDVTGAISVTCGSGVPYSITLGKSANYGSEGSWMMKRTGGTDLVEYELYTLSTRTTASKWYGSVAVSGTGNGSPQSIPVYGRVLAATPVLGDYTDSVPITVSY
jgi:spore coat protein U-like protein